MDKKARVFSTPNCSHCIRLKQFLKENNVEFEDIDISNNQEAAQEMIKKSGQMSVPVLEVDGEIVVSFDRNKIKTLLGL
ncbi:MAG: thioredoxin family protein [Omnitrophica bacterium]|nr:thioredoxin family protein [Candidatus Omnitrophota bacterium]